MDMASWTSGEPCDEDGLPFCHRCKPRDLPATVFVTAGGAAFHRRSDCGSLVDAQAQIARRGGDPAPVETVHPQVALGAGRTPCLACFHWARGSLDAGLSVPTVPMGQIRPMREDFDIGQFL